MAEQSLSGSPGPGERQVRDPAGQILTVPEGWVLVQPGDAALTRRIKAAGPAWTLQEKQGRRTFSRGIWAPGPVVQSIRSALEQERATPAYAKRLSAGRRRRDDEQTEYVEDFHQAVVRFLCFAPLHGAVAERLAAAVTRHATPVGSGTVARTERITLADRAEAAVIAWMRHQTTAYDQMKIERVRGKRREVRRRLAGISNAILERYRRGKTAIGDCPLQRALFNLP